MRINVQMWWAARTELKVSAAVLCRSGVGDRREEVAWILSPGNDRTDSAPSC